MASLSNINGLFDVHSTGAILFSDEHGTTGQILRSNGDAAPTWIDFSSTGFGGDYLLLTGGVLTGNLTINGTNNLTVGGNLFVTGTSTLTGALSGSTGAFSSTLTVGGALTVSGLATLDDVNVTDTLAFYVSGSDVARQRADARDDATSFARLHWFGKSDTAGTSNFRHAYYDGANYINVTASAGIITYTGGATFTGLVSGITPTAAANFATKAYADGLTPGAGVFLPLAGGTVTGSTDFTAGTYPLDVYGIGSTASSSAVGLGIYGSSSAGAIMHFHRPGAYAVNFGLDSDNVLRIGGWSASANRWTLDMLGNNTVAGSFTATSLAGAGSAITSLNAGNLASGTVPYARAGKVLPTSGNYVWQAATLAGAYLVGVQTSFVAAAQGWPNYGAVLHVGARGGTDAGGDYQIYCGHGANYGGNHLRFRNADNDATPSDSWTDWKTIWDSVNLPSGSGVTSVATGNGLTGGTITSTGTLTMSGDYTGDLSITGANLAGNSFSDPDIVLSVTDQDTTYSLRNKMSGSSALTKVSDATAPAPGCFQVNGSYYPQGFGPYYKIDEGDEFIFEFWIRYVSGTATYNLLYAGSNFYNAAGAYLGNSQRYWGESGLNINANTGTGWYHVSGTLGPTRGSGTGDIPTAAVKMRLLFLFNYNPSGTIVTNYCGLKVYKSNPTVTKLYRKTLGSEAGTTRNRDLVIDSNGIFYSGNGNAGLPSHTFTNDADTGMYRSTTNALGFATAGTQRMLIKANGQIDFASPGTPNQSGISMFGGSSGGIMYMYRPIGQNGDIIRFQTAISSTSSTRVGYINTTGSATTYNSASDYRLKENVVKITGALDRVSKLKPSRFNFIIEPENTVDGFIAHEVQEVVPEAVTGYKDEVDENGENHYQGMDNSRLVPLLAAAIQELEARVKELENK